MTQTIGAIRQDVRLAAAYKLHNIEELIPAQHAVGLRRFLRELEELPYFKPESQLREGPNLRVFYSDTHINALRMAKEAMGHQTDLPEERRLVSRLGEVMRERGRPRLFRALQIAEDNASRISTLHLGMQPWDIRNKANWDAVDMAKAIVLWGFDLDNGHVRLRDNVMRIWKAGYGSAGFVLEDKQIAHYAFSENF